MKTLITAIIVSIAATISYAGELTPTFKDVYQHGKKQYKVTFYNGEGWTFKCIAKANFLGNDWVWSNIKPTEKEYTITLSGADFVRNNFSCTSTDDNDGLVIAHDKHEVDFAEYALNSVGVEIIRTPVICDDMYGIYNRSSNTMLICSKASKLQQRQTFVHEAVHVIQDCRMGLDNDKDHAYESKYASFKTKQWVYNLYAPEDHIFEIEAESYARGEWTWVNTSLADMIEQTCK